jgi:hypothetical protein
VCSRSRKGHDMPEVVQTDEVVEAPRPKIDPALVERLMADAAAQKCLTIGIGLRARRTAFTSRTTDESATMRIQ